MVSPDGFASRGVLTAFWVQNTIDFCLIAEYKSAGRLDVHQRPKRGREL
jgi:hypothetical protein